jgi:signal transduction histidine kinase/DNA-binding response OmpR family regulator
MVVDDESIVALDLQSSLENMGYNVPAVVASGEEAVSAAGEVRPDLILMDISLNGGMDGVQAAEQIRSRFSVPVIYLSAFSNDHILQRAKQTEPYGYLLKPYVERELHTTIEMALHKARSEARLKSTRDELEVRVVERTAALETSNASLRQEITTRQEAEAALEQSRTELETWVQERTVALQAANNKLQREIQERQRAESVLVRQTVTLTKTTTMLVEKERLLNAFQQIGQALLASMDLEQILDTLATQVLQASIFRKISIARLDERTGDIEIVRSLACQMINGRVVPESVFLPAGHTVGQRLPGKGKHVFSEVLRRRQMVIIDTAVNKAEGLDLLADEADELVYLIPVKQGNRILAVLATTSDYAEKAEMLQRIAGMQPLLDAIAIALEHARLYSGLQVQTRQLIRLERLQALGEMAVGVSHNLNNLLVAVLVPAQFLQKAVSDPKIRKEADEIVQAGRRAADLVRRLYQAVYIPEDERLEAVDVNQIVRQTVEATRPRWQDEPQRRGVRIAMRTELGEVPAVQGMANGLADACSHLIANAVDAMSASGTITIRTATGPLGGQVIVQDTGMGMTEEVQRRVFEPLFTTKDDVGTGLGLSTVYKTVTHWGGSIDIESAPGAGATFSICLPLWRPPEEETAKAPAVATRSGRILVVEDDEGVSQALANLLSEGHEVVAVDSGPAALARVGQDHFDAAMIDFGMPEMSGDVVARALRENDPTLATVLITGWEIREGDPKLAPFDFFLQKPFGEVEEIQQIVAQAIALHDTRQEKLDRS